MLFEVNVVGTNSKKKETLGDFTKPLVLENFDKIPWEKIINQLKENNISEKDSPSFGIVNKKDNYGLIVAPINDDGWVIYFKQDLRNKVFFGLFENKKVIFTEKRKQDLKTAKDCVTLFLNQEYHSLEKICDKKSF